MGLDINTIKLLIAITKKEISLRKVLTIGRQNIHVKDKELGDILTHHFPDAALRSFMQTDHTYCEGLLKIFGAQIVDSIDASAYENATIIHDMNYPVPEKLLSQFDTVIDGGSLEHIFNFPTAIKNCMDLLKPGGFYIGITPSNNFFGHGFYQFSPELYFRVFSEENGFSLKRMLLYSDSPKGNWYEIKDPRSIGNRITLVNSRPLYLFVLAQKSRNTTPQLNFPQQSDYSDIVWKKMKLSRQEAIKTIGLVRIIKRVIPNSIKRNILQVWRRLKIIFTEAGNLDSFNYKRIKKL
jgi:SAM-dependent methyltransferase